MAITEELSALRDDTLAAIAAAETDRKSVV